MTIINRCGDYLPDESPRSRGGWRVNDMMVRGADSPDLVPAIQKVDDIIAASWLTVLPVYEEATVRIHNAADDAKAEINHLFDELERKSNERWDEWSRKFEERLAQCRREIENALLYAKDRLEERAKEAGVEWE